MPIEAVQQRIAYIQEFYQRTDENVQARYTQEYVYLPKERMDQFVEDASNRLLTAYQYLWVENQPVGNVKTILEILTKR